MVATKYSWQCWVGGVSITIQIWHQSRSANSSQMGKQGESHHIPPSVPSPESEALWARMHARAHSCIAQTSRCSRFSVQDRTFYQTFSTRPATNMQNIPPCEIPACLLVHPLRLRRGGGRPRSGEGMGGGCQRPLRGVTTYVLWMMTINTF